VKKYLMIVAILAVGTTALAEKEVKLEETVITTENFETSVQETPKNITIVTSEEIANKGANTVAEALKGVPGINISTLDGGEATIDLRGYGATGSQNTLILIDGIPMNNIQGSGYYTSLIPVEMIDKIEVIPAGGAVMYGDGATGGVVNIITKSPQNKENYGSLGFEVGSWGTTKGNIHYGTKVNDRLLMDVSYTNYKTEGYRDIATKEYDKDDKKESIWLRGKYILDNGSIEANYRHNENEDYYTGSLTKAQFEEDPTMPGTWEGLADSTEDSYTLKYIQKINDNLDLLVYGGYEELEYNGDSSWPVHYIATQSFIKPQIKYNYGENSYIILGGDYKDGESEDQINKSAKDKTRESYAGYIMNKTTMEKWQFTQGYRRENLKYEAPVNGEWKDEKLNVDSYELAVNYLYSDTGNIYLSYVNGYRSPSIQDLGLWYGELGIQETETYELGLKDTIGNTYISSSIFFSKTSDEILYAEAPNGNKYNHNFDGKVERKGVQLSLQHYFDKLILRESMSHIDAEVTSGKYDGKKFAGVPEWTVNLGATYNFTDKLLGNIDMYYQSSAYGNSDFKNDFGKNNEYTTVDTNLKYSFDNGLEIYGGIRNLFDKEYCTSFISYGSYYPADGRSYYAGFRYSF
jgi:iron complex outermembrane receptor protein